MGIITQEGLPENCDSAYIFTYICASFLACLPSSLPGEEEDQSLAMLMMNVHAKLFVLACLFVIISGRQRPCGKSRNIEYCVCADGKTYEGRSVTRSCKLDDNPVEECSCKDGSYWPADEYEDIDRPCGSGRNIEYCVCADGETYEGRSVTRSCKLDDNPVDECKCKDGSYWPADEYEEDK